MCSLRVSWRAEQPRAHEGVIPLGSGAVADAGVGPKAALVDRAARHGLAVPRGFVLTDGVDLDASTLETVLGSAGPDHRVAVRSAFSTEDTSTSSRAGFYLTRLDVATEDVVGAIAEVRDSATRDGLEPGLRRDVLVMEMVQARHSGVAFSEPGTYDDLVNVTDGLAEGLVSGTVAGERILLARLEKAPSGWPRRLARLLRRIRSLFGDEPWDVEWADDGQTCWLIQLRAITAPTRRDEMLTIANHAEILPPLPSTFMTSVIAEAGPDLFAWYRRADPRLPANRDFLTVVAGRPFINLSLLEDMLRHLGLPTRLVADSIGGPPSVDRGANPLRMLRRSPALVRLGSAQITAVATSRRRERHCAAAGVPPPESWTNWVEQVRGAYTDLVTGMFPLSSAIGPPLAILRRCGTLTAHAVRHRSVTSRLAEARDAAASGGPGSPAHDDFLATFGHRGIYESDLARPRYRDDPALIGSVGTTSVPTPPRRNWRWWVTLPVWWLARAPLAARERLRHEAMKGFATLRDRGLEMARFAVERGQLRTPEDLFDLTAAEVRRLDSGWSPEESLWARRHEERSRWAQLSPPAVVARFTDPEDWNPISVSSQRCQGLSLGGGRVHGRAWVLQEPATSLPDGFDPATTVLIARSVDAGWIATFALVAAVVVETGGDLSHGSILLRERAIPSITNARGALVMFTTGDQVEVRADNGVVIAL